PETARRARDHGGPGTCGRGVSDPEPPAKRVRRGEGEVTQWPRGLVDYVPARRADATPDPEEDRVRNRLLLAGRLIGLLRSRGLPVETELATLRRLEEQFRVGDREVVAGPLDRLLGELDRRLTEAAAAPPS
ncbi:MAG: hypothetical protein WAK40_05340, partial [Thermoplasmata archaeon]